MRTRVLVVYASRAGSTGDIAQLIGETLNERGFHVDVRTIKSRPQIENYQAVLIGSAIRRGTWLPEAVTFVAHHQAELHSVPVVLFTVHMYNAGDDPVSVANRRAYLNTVRPLLQPAAEVYFRGAIDPQRLALLERLLVRFTQAPIGDFREWDQIRDWAQTILPEALPDPV
jgi:menaquinone-dependent protoporphyrinogen oxidase